MENETKKEIDLIDAIESVISAACTWVKKFFSLIGWIFRVIYKEKILVGVFILLGILLGLYLSRVKIYRGEVELKINAHDAYFYKNIIDPMYNQCKYRDMKTIADNFGFNDEDAQKIMNVQAFHYIDYLSDGTPNEIDYKNKFNASDTIDMIMSDRLRLVVDCSDTAVFSKMIEGFSYFFANNPQIVKENKLRKNQLEEKITAVSNEIYMLDSLRKKEYFIRKKDVQLSTDKMLLVEREMKLYHVDLLALEDRKQQLVWDRDVFEDGVSFSSNFEVNPHPINNWLKQCLMGAVIFFIIGSCVAIIKVKRETVISYLRKGI